MATNKMDDTAVQGVATQLSGGATFVVDTLSLRLMSDIPDETVHGTELPTAAGTGTGAGYTVGGQTITPTVTGGVQTATNIRWDNMAPVTVKGWEVWSGTTQRLWQGDFGNVDGKIVGDGDPFIVDTTTLTLD